MSEKIRVDSAVIKILYYRYKSYILPAVAFLLSAVVFVQFAMPQILTFLATRDQIAVNEQDLVQLTQNYNTIASLSSNTLEKYTSIANQALPAVKDFAGILTAISNAAGASGVIVNDYTFNVGDINTPGQNAANNTITISLSILGTIDQTKQFVTVLSKSLPLAEVTNINILSGAQANITANFFYSPSAKPSFVDTNPLPVLSVSQKKILDIYLQDNGQTQVPSRNVSPTLPPLITPKVTLSPSATPTPSATPSGSLQ